MLNFLGRNQQPEVKKMYLLHEKQNSICPARWSARNPLF